MRKRPLLLCACVFLTGLVYQRYCLKLIVVSVILFLIKEWYFGRKGRSVILLSIFLLGVFHMQREESFRDAYMSKIVDGSWVTVWGELIKTEPAGQGCRGLLSDCYIDFGEGTIPCNDILVYTSQNHWEVGQIHKISGKFNMFENARNEGNFDALLYYQSLKIDFAVDGEEFILLSNNKSEWKLKILALKEKVHNVYEGFLSEKAAGFYQAMVLGDKMDLDEKLKALFLLGGISHILAISGLHMSILGRGLYHFLRNLGVGFGISGLCGSVLLFFYCIMVGSSVSTVRAFGMLVCFFLAQWLGRSYDMLNALGGMMLYLLWDNPFLIENSGFWFSVTALLGVGFVGRELSTDGEKTDEEEKKEGKKRFRIKPSGVWMSLGITLTTLPVTALSYFEVPMYSTLVNLIVLPLLSPVFCLAVIAGILGTFGIMQSGVWILFRPCEWLLSFYEWVCVIVEKLPFKTILTGKPEWWQVVLYYLILFVGIYVLKILSKRKMKNKKVVLLGIILSCMFCLFFPKIKETEITFLDVGQGDGIYIHAGDGTECFIDGGSSNVKGVGEYRILPFLKAKRVKEIDYWFVSHTDTDHISGLYEVLESGYKVRNILLHEHCSNDENYKRLLFLAESKGVKVVFMKAGQKIRSRNMTVTALSSGEYFDETGNIDKNDTSLVLQVNFNIDGKSQHSFKALFAGDISTEVEEELCRKGIIESVDLFKANHHGSNSSNGTVLFETIQPKYIVVSCSETNQYGHPGKEAVKRMKDCDAKIFYTMENGQITFPLIQ